MQYNSNTPAPDGWVWESRPGTNRYGERIDGWLSFDNNLPSTPEEAVALYSALYSWGIQWESLTVLSGEETPVGSISVQISVQTRARVFPDLIGRTGYLERYWPDQWCRYGQNHGTSRLTLTCDHGLDGPESMIDILSGSLSHTAWTPEVDGYRSTAVVQRCGAQASAEVRALRSETEQYTNDRNSAGYRLNSRYCNNGVEPGFSACTDCEPRLPCERCHVETSHNNGWRENETDRFYCNSCTAFHCDGCGRWEESPIRFSDVLSARLCSECRLTVESDRFESFDLEVDSVTPDQLALVPNPHRPIRTCSIELETVEGGVDLAAALTRAGLADQGAQVLHYHSSDDISTNAFCHVERDSSLGNGGGELIFDRIHLDNAQDVANLHHAISVVRQQIKEGYLQISTSCGLHIHVDAHQFGIGDVRNLVLITNYLEDVLYRLSAARWKRHRGTQYSSPLAKGPFTTRADFGIHFFPTNGHASALNIGHYWEAMRGRCRCGAVMVGEHQTCTCNLGKCTFEFRFFNGTSNFRKVHAYAAISQSLVSYAKLIPDLGAEELPIQGYDGRFTNAGEAKKTKWDERLRWMLTNLYFSNNERESFRYCVDNSILSLLGIERIESIFETQYSVPDSPAQEITRHPRNAEPEQETFTVSVSRSFAQLDADFWDGNEETGLSYIEDNEEF